MIDHNCRPDIAHGCLCATCARDPGTDGPNGCCCEWHSDLQFASDPECACGERVASCPDYQSETAITAAQDATPAFDYAGLSAQTVATLHSAEDMIRSGYRTAKAAYRTIASAVGMAHDELVQQLDGKRKPKDAENTFCAWCTSIGISRSLAYQLLQVSDLILGSTPNEQKVLEALPITLLYAAAKPSAPPELVERVKKGEIATHKEYQAEREALIARVEQAEQRAAAAKKALQTERDARAADKQQVAQLQAENRELQKRPVAELLSPDPAEIDRLVDERLKNHARQPPTPDEIMAIYGRMQRYTSSVRDQWDTLRPQLPVLPPDMQRSFCTGLRKELARMMHEIGEEVSM